jgi:pimeloyl-ACP methyl ester carboxylesterase
MKPSSLFRLVWILCLGIGLSAYSAAQTVRVGQLNQSAFRIDVPSQWNHRLVIYLHGYSMEPFRFDNSPLAGNLQLFIGMNYALAQPGYSAEGWSVQQGETDAIRLFKYFCQHYGKPSETYVVGESLGGFLTVVLIEHHPNYFAGALAMCAPLGSADWFMARRVFDSRVVFDYYFPGVLPPPNRESHVSYQAEQSNTEHLTQLFSASPAKAGHLREYLSVTSDQEAAYLMTFFTEILQDDFRKAGANPFDNTTVLYRLADPEESAALNEGVARYRGDPKAEKYLEQYFTLSGNLKRHLLVLQTVYDPLIPSWLTNSYETLVERHGATDLFQQEFVPSQGHCNFTETSIQTSFRQLVGQTR